MSPLAPANRPNAMPFICDPLASALPITATARMPLLPSRSLPRPIMFNPDKTRRKPCSCCHAISSCCCSSIHISGPESQHHVIVTLLLYVHRQLIVFAYLTTCTLPRFHLSEYTSLAPRQHQVGADRTTFPPQPRPTSGSSAREHDLLTSIH